METFKMKCLSIGVLTLLLVACSSNKKSEKEEEALSQQPKAPAIEYEVANDKKQLTDIYELPHMKEWYKERVLPPKFDFDMDLSSKSYIELLLLQNEMYARNGYLFMDAAIRGYFNQFKWYQPVFDVKDFKVQLSEEESRFIDKILKLRKEKYESQYLTDGGYKLINPDFVFNRIQFKEVNQDLVDHLKKMNFALAPASREQLFYVYDENQYQYIPNFYTTDLYFQLLHKYMASLLQSVEGGKMIDLVTKITQQLYKASAGELKLNSNEATKRSIAWANAYTAIAYSVATGKNVQVDASLKQFYLDELGKINKATGLGSAFLDNRLLDYAQYKPVGNYTKDDTLKKYFRCVKWLNTAAISMENETQFLAAALLSLWINNDASLQKNFQTFNSIIGSFAGDEDGASISLMTKVLKELNISKSADLNKLNLDRIKNRVNALKVDKIKPKAANQIAADEFRKNRVFFTAGRYTFDSEILIRFVNVLEPKPKRPFPKGLDVFASMGNSEAKKILLETYREKETWKEYDDTLSLLTDKFSGFNEWDKSIYNKTFECINAINIADDKYPLFMQTPFWARKNLSTSLAAWTELKHDLTLYTEHPYAAEAGEGGVPPPPIHLSYVEPNLKFWQKAIELLDHQLSVLGDAGLLDEEDKRLGEDIKEEGQFFLKIVEKELSKTPLSEDDFRKLTWMGGSIEHLTFRTIHTDHLPEREKQIALAADVYSFNDKILQEGVGLGDEIYVIAEINGYPYLTKGACFSYYEFISGERLTDEEWQAQIAAGKTPDRPIWLKELYANTPSLESKQGYSF